MNSTLVIEWIWLADSGNTWFFKELDINKQSPQKLGESLNIDFNLIGGVPEKTEYRLSYKMEEDNEWHERR